MIQTPQVFTFYTNETWNLLNLHLWSNFQDVPKHYKTNGVKIVLQLMALLLVIRNLECLGKRKRDGFTCTDLLCVFSRSQKKNMSTPEFKFLSLPFVKQINMIHMSLTYSRRHFFQNNQLSWGNYSLWMPVALPQQLDPTGGAKHWKIALQCPRSASTIWPVSLLNSWVKQCEPQLEQLCFTHWGSFAEKRWVRLLPWLLLQGPRRQSLLMQTEPKISHWAQTWQQWAACWEETHSPNGQLILLGILYQIARYCGVTTLYTSTQMSKHVYNRQSYEIA